MTKIVIPPPIQTVVGDDARLTEPWRFHLDKTNAAVNAGSQLITSSVVATTATTGVTVKIPENQWNTVRLTFRDFRITSTAGSLCIRLSSDNGATFVSTGYLWNRFHVTDTTFARAGSTNDGTLQLAQGVTTSLSLNGDATIFPLAANSRLLFRTVYIDSQTTPELNIVTGGGRGVIGNLNAVLLHTTVGTFTDGKINLYGDR